MLLRCELVIGDKPTRNGRMYPHHVLRAMVKEFNQRVPADQNLIGFYDGESGLDASLILQDAVLLADSPVRLKDKHRRMEFDAHFMETERAKMVQAALDADERLTRMELLPVVFGELDKENNVVEGATLVRWVVLVVKADCWLGSETIWPSGRSL